MICLHFLAKLVTLNQPKAMDQGRVCKTPGSAPRSNCMTRDALELLGSKRNDAYEAALAALREDTQVWWADTLASDADELGEGKEPATADVEGLRSFLEGEVQWFENRRKEIANRPLIREQAFGDALDPNKLERLGRYEVHLDRKL